jgi:hypothetical protein
MLKYVNFGICVNNFIYDFYDSEACVSSTNFIVIQRSPYR